MTNYLRDLRLLPIAVVASACLLALVAADLVLGRHASDSGTAGITEASLVHAGAGTPASADTKRSWAQQMFNFPGSQSSPPQRRDLSFLPVVPPLAAGGAADQDRNGEIITGTVTEPAADKGEKAKGEGAAPASKDAASKEKAGKNVPSNGPKEPPPSPNGTVVPLNAPPAPTGAERAILERLQERRQELDKRARELDIREGLIAEAEKRVDAKLAAIKAGEAQLTVAAQKKDEAEAARFKGLVTMYENMKPRDAAKIFDRLEVGVLIEVASLINPRNMSEILAQMSPDKAEQLTVELANRAQASPKNLAAGLPKIEGRPTSQ
jgi:flagellar motility protein MotE (MotC chaperone)